MREIKFRGVSMIDGTWVYGGLQTKRYLSPESGVFKTIYSVETINELDWTSVNRIVLVFEETLGQYTGLKDKNGKEIYEGDIVKNALGDIGKIIYIDKYSAFIVKGWENGYKLWFEDNIEVIGNIYDNPELLKGE